jgi:hypothetical protein
MELAAPQDEIPFPFFLLFKQWEAYLSDIFRKGKKLIPAMDHRRARQAFVKNRIPPAICFFLYII